MARTIKRTLRHRRRTQRNKRNAFRGGGYATTNSLMPFNPADDMQFAVKSPVYQQYDDCYAQSRPGAIANPASPELAQTVMAGGGSCGMVPRGGRRRNTRRRAGGSCGCSMIPQGGRLNSTRRQRGGANYAFAVQPNNSVGGDGPNAAPVYAGVPCDARAGSPNPHNPSFVNPDIRAPSDLYSLTANMPAQQGGGLANEECSRQRGGSGNGFSADCYRAPNSMIPVYPAESAGFHFRPSTEFGSTLPDGVTAYNDVVPQAARLGGARRRSKRSSRRR
jgi:hypothetical protein